MGIVSAALTVTLMVLAFWGISAEVAVGTYSRASAVKLQVGKFTAAFNHAGSSVISQFYSNSGMALTYSTPYSITMSQPTLVTSPPRCVNFRLTYPAPYVLLVTFEREKAMNSLTFAMHWALAAVWDWFDSEPDLRVAVVTGQGTKSFCAGQDLMELRGRGTGDDPKQYIYPKGGFAGISRRSGKKPIIAAVNGYALGGGFEMALNCDMVVASPTACFGLPEALRGLYAAAGGLPRLMHIVGPFIATEVALTGLRLSAQEALVHKLANRVSKTNESCVDEAIELAQKCAEVSPDAALVSRVALREAWETGSVERGVELVEGRYRKRLHEGENSREGLRAFAEKRKPNWVASKL